MIHGLRPTWATTGLVLSIILIGHVLGDLFSPAHAQRAAANRYNGFDVSNSTIPVTAIMKGGPPRDGIPAILEPTFESVDEASWLNDDDVIIGLEHDGVAKAYPLRILVWHELVNDEIGGKPVLITYCPLCGTAMVFERSASDRQLTFGVSGLLYQSDVLMYDHQTESLWSQLEMKAVSGPMVGTPLAWLPSDQMTWSKWREENPQTLALSRDTGFSRDYGRMPYENYSKSQQVMFPVPEHRSELPRKDWVLGIVVDDTAKAYPIDRLRVDEVVMDEINGKKIRIEWDQSADHATVRSEGEMVPSVRVFWFAWQAFYPDTLLYSGEK